MESTTAFNLPALMQSPQTLNPDAIHEAIAKKYPKACIVCRTRKVRCDRKFPCGTCKRWNIADCVYPNPIRTSPRPKKDDCRGTGNARDGGDKSLLERVRTLELMVVNLGGTVPAENSVGGLGTHPVVTEGTPPKALTEDCVTVQQSPKANYDEISQVEKGLGKLLVKDAQSRYLSEGFWVNVDDVCTLLPVLETSLL